MTSTADSHSIGDTLPNFHFDTATAMAMATMNASVPRMAAAVAASAPSPSWVSLNTAKKINKGPKSIKKGSNPPAFFGAGAAVAGGV